MKTNRLLLFILVVISTLTFSRAANTDVDIHCTPKRVDATAPKNESDNSRTVAKEHWNYEVTVENKTFNAMAAIEIKYMSF